MLESISKNNPNQIFSLDYLNTLIFMQKEI
jgi:hypothetical protein